MINRKYWYSIASLSVFAISIHLFSLNPLRVEKYYSTGIYQYVSRFLRHLLGWLPISIGDILYGFVVAWLLIKLVKTIRLAIRRKATARNTLFKTQRVVIVLLCIYIVFNAFWGINYNRIGIADQLGITLEKYSVSELKTLNNVLLQKIDSSCKGLNQQIPQKLSSKEIFSRSQDAYRQINQQYPFLEYYPASIKTSLWGWMGNYVGFLGYYNPFTGEGQVNTMVPKFLQPYTCCHEMAHQLGYAKENEASFVGYLAAAASKDEYFKYSVYVDLFLYANRNLYFTDSLAAKANMTALPPMVKNDLKEWRQFNLRHKNPIEPIIRWGYGKYLENNQQPSGLLSYDEVTGFMIAYYKKFGKI